MSHLPPLFRNNNRLAPHIRKYWFHSEYIACCGRMKVFFLSRILVRWFGIGGGEKVAWVFKKNIVEIMWSSLDGDHEILSFMEYSLNKLSTLTSCNVSIASYVLKED